MGALNQQLVLREDRGAVRVLTMTRVAKHVEHRLDCAVTLASGCFGVEVLLAGVRWGERPSIGCR